jgi:hypothetical protein
MAQQNSIAKQRRALNAALTTIEDYSVWSTISNDEAYYEFLNLFDKKESLVYNDLLGVKQGNSITAEEYANTLRYQLRNKIVFIRNVKNEGVSFENGKTLIRLSLEKSISYIDSCGTYYSSSEFYDTHDYRLSATLDYDSAQNICKIIGISGTIDSPKKLGANHFAFVRTNSRDNDLHYKGELLKFNSYDQALLDGDRDPQSLRRNFTYSSSDMELRPQTGDCQVTMRYKMRRMRLRPYFAFGLGKAFSRDGDDILSDSKSTGYSFGIDFGLGILSKRAFSLGVYTGLGLSMSTLDLSYENEDYNFLSDGDVDGDNYYRHYQDLSLSQKMKFSELNIPLYIDLNIKIVNSLSLYADLGARFDMNLGHKVNSTEGSAYVYGIYPSYNNLRLDEQWNFNGFGSHRYSNSDLLSSDLIDVSKITVNAIGGFGLRYNFSRIPISIEAGMDFVMGLNNLVGTSNIATIENSTPVIYNTISGRESTEHVRNLSEMLKSVKRQQLRVHIGMIYKF